MAPERSRWRRTCRSVCCSISADDVRNRHPLHRIVVHMAAGVECRLEVDAANRRMLNRELNDLADLVLVHPSLDGGNQRDVEAN